MTTRTRRSIAGSVLLVVGLVFGAVIVTALRAEGRERTEAKTNDGGAWLLKRDLGYVGHVNRAAKELTAAVSVAGAGADFDVDQAEGVILVHDRTAGSLVLVNDSTARLGNQIPLDASIVAHAVDGGALLVNHATLAVYRLSVDELTSLEDGITQAEPIVQGEGPARAASFPDGHAVIVDQSAGDVVFIDPEGGVRRSPATELTDTIVSITALGPDTAVFVDQDGDLYVATPDEIRTVSSGVTDASGEPARLILQQPGLAADHVVAAVDDGRLVTIPIDEGNTDGPTELQPLPAGGPVEPIVFRGCVYAVSTSGTPTFLQQCGDRFTDERALDGAGAELRLREVNGWIWINDIDSGAAWVTEPERRLDQVEDWGAVLSDLSDDSNDDNQPNEGDEVETIVDPDDPTAEIVESDAIDETGANEPPIARDDVAATRVERPTDVKVLSNDSDPNNDVILITTVEPTGGDAVISIAPGGRSVQVAPAVAFAGVVSFNYTISDGRGGTASAAAAVTVSPSNGDTNRPPEPVNDIASTRRGRATSFDVLANDSDPDGDALVLESVVLSDQESLGLIVPNPSGQVVFTPDPNTRTDRIELTYVVSDDYGATAEGTVVVDVRLEDSNNEPDARNDSGVTVVGKPVRIDVVHNDTDPDNDTLFTAAQPTLRAPADQTIDALDVTLTSDGEFYFNPSSVGTFVFNYAVTDGEEQDIAQIRVDVDEAIENRAPVAVRDDIVIPAGGTRLVYVLTNDGDPDSDVVSIVGHTTDDSLTIKEVDGVGFLVTVAADAPPRPTFLYSISDGQWPEPITATVVVAVTDAQVLDQPPVARDDVVEVRAGSRVPVTVLENDNDPEGGLLEVVDVTTGPGVETSIGLNGQSVSVGVGADVVSSFTLSYTIADEGGNQANAFIQVRIVPPDEVNRPPVARTDIARTQAGTPVVIDVRANDTDPDGDLFVLEAVSAQPSGGPAVVQDGAVLYTPAETFSGTDRFSYAIVDAGGAVSIGQVLVGVTPRLGENRAPEAFDDPVTVIAGSAPIVLDVLANDNDPDGDALAVTQVGAASAGATLIEGGGAGVVFSPPDTTGQADGSPLELTVPYSIADGRGGTAAANVAITVTTAGTVLAPIAVDDLRGPLKPGDVIEIDLLANDVDPDGNPAELIITSDDPALAEINDDVVTFTAGATTGRHSYTVTDADGLTSTAEVAVLVVDNRAPNVAPIEIEMTADGVETIDIAAAAGVTDADGDPLFYACCGDLTGGATTVEATGGDGLVVQFDPDDGFSGPASFTYTVDDQRGHTVSGAVSIDVLAPANQPPTAAAGAFEVEAGKATPIDLTALVGDPDGPTGLAYTVGAASNGAVQLAPDGATVTATAAIDQANQSSTFDYTVTDPAGAVASATVTLTVTAPSAPPPIARADEATTNQEQPVTIKVLANDVDPLGQGLTIASADGSSSGTATVNGAQITFTPGAGFFGQASFTYTIRDGAALAERESTAQVTVVVIGRPGAPSAPVAIAGNASAVVNWSAPQANGAGIDDFAIRIGGAGDGQSVGTATGHTFSGLRNGAPVQFSVRAHNTAGWGEWSPLSEAVTPDIEPERPAAPTAQFADGALIVTWSPPPDNGGSAILGYDIQIGGGASGVQPVGAVTQYRWDGLQNGTEYTFQVRARNAKGNGAYSNPSASEHPLTNPNPPNTPVGQRGDRYIDITWDPAGNGGDAITQFEVTQVSTGATATTNATSFRWSNLPNGTAQRFTVRASNRAGWSGASGASAAVVPCGNPTQPTGVTATRGDQQATVTWAPADPNGCAISNYTVTSSGGQSVTVGGGATSTVVGGLTNGTGYTFTVTATNEVGAGGASGASNEVVPAGPPCAPTLTDARPGVREVTLQWTQPCDNGAAISHFELSTNGGAWQNVGNVNQFTKSGLQNGREYTFRVRAVNNVDASAVSNARSATTFGEPNQVGGLSVTSPGRGEIQATWSRPNANGSPIEYFEVQGPDDRPRHPDTLVNWRDLPDNRTYSVRVRACNAVGCGAWSPTKSATTPAPPPPPRNVTWSSYGNAQGQPNCSTSLCRYVRARGTGFAPGQSYTVTCHGSVQGSFSGTPRTADGNGVVVDDNACYFGYNETFWVSIGGVESDRRQWPG